MKTGKITAKLRDAVPVCLMVEGKKTKRYKNIDLPEMLKEAEIRDFHFNLPSDGKITFEISYAQGVLPEIFPKARPKMTKTEKATAKTAAKAATETPTALSEKGRNSAGHYPEAPAPEPEKAEDTTTKSEAAEESTVETNEPAEGTTPARESGTMEIFYNVTGSCRKELEAATGNFIGVEPKYMKVPTYAFVVENYTIGRGGTPSEKKNKALVESFSAT